MRRFSGTVLIVALLASVPIMLGVDQAAAGSHRQKAYLAACAQVGYRPQPGVSKPSS